MNNEPKKISFGFNKFSKKPNIIISKQTVEENKVQLIEYVEKQSIKVIGKDDNKVKTPLIIPMKQTNNKLTNLIDIVKNDFKEPQEKKEVENKTTTEENQVQETLTLDEQAARELLNDVKGFQPKEENKRIIDVPKVDKITFEGEKESSLEDYENVPIEQYGKAMLRGMGWKDGQGIGKSEQLIKVSQPLVRPKGMGLGADKITKQDADVKPAVDRDGKVLKCVKGAYIKIIAGYHKGKYGQILGLDDESGRFIIKITLNNINVSLNEFLVFPVTKEEFTKNSKVLNNAKYEEYIKKKELEGQLKVKKSEHVERETANRRREDKTENHSDCSEDETYKRRKQFDDKHKDRREMNKYRTSSNSERDKSFRKDKRRVKKERTTSESDYEEARKTSRDRKKHDRKSEKNYYAKESESERESEKQTKSKKKHKKNYSSEDSSDDECRRKSTKSSESKQRKYKKEHGEKRRK